MRQSRVGLLVVRHYDRLPLRKHLLNYVVRREGGQMFSLSLRTLLRERANVLVGDYSYGSLLELGSADPFTTIGNYVSIGRNVVRFGAAHPLDELCLHPFWYNPRLGFVGTESDVSRTPCEIAHGAWIGANVTILPGCRRIGVGAVVGAASVVTKDVPDFAIVAGNPAKFIGLRLDEETREALMTDGHWELDPDRARAHLDSLKGRA